MLMGNDLICKILFLDPAVFEDGPFQIRSEGDVAFFVALAMERDHIVPDVFFQNVTHFGVSGTGVESDCQDQFVPGREEGREVKDFQKGTNLFICEGFNEDFTLFLPTDFCGGVGGEISFLGSIAKVSSDAT